MSKWNKNKFCWDNDQSETKAQMLFGMHGALLVAVTIAIIKSVLKQWDLVMLRLTSMHLLILLGQVVGNRMNPKYSKVRRSSKQASQQNLQRTMKRKKQDFKDHTRHLHK